MIENEKSPQTKSYMLAHLSEIGVTLNDFPWEVVREWSNTVLSDIGQGSYSWRDGHRIEKEKVMKLMSVGGVAGSSASLADKNACLMFNATKCIEPDSHGTKCLHVCSFCLAAFNAEHDHPVVACNKRLYFKKGRDRGFHRDKDQDPGAGRQNQDPQQQQGKHRGNYGQFYQPRFQNPPPPRHNWNQPPPNDAKNWLQPTQ